MVYGLWLRHLSIRGSCHTITFQAAFSVTHVHGITGSMDCCNLLVLSILTLWIIVFFFLCVPLILYFRVGSIVICSAVFLSRFFGTHTSHKLYFYCIVFLYPCVIVFPSRVHHSGLLYCTIRLYTLVLLWRQRGTSKGRTTLYLEVKSNMKALFNSAAHLCLFSVDALSLLLFASYLNTNWH